MFVYKTSCQDCLDYKLCNSHILMNPLPGISLDIFEGQIFCLLGHNGAGKTTLINLLTGLMDANDGSATIYGHNIRNPIEMESIRLMTGVCNQQNTIFDYLTPQEHLKIYAGLKGIPDEEVDGEVRI